MLFKQQFLAGVADGSLDLAFRRWEKPRVKPGSQLRTAIGVLEVRAVDVVAQAKITEREAKRAGFASRGELLALLKANGPGRTYRVALRRVGEDPRIALRQSSRLSAADVADLRGRLDRMDRASRRGPWTARVLQLIADHPGVRAGDLAADEGRERRLFKADVRKLKELGLTESLEVGYRLSPRGRALLKKLP